MHRRVIFIILGAAVLLTAIGCTSMRTKIPGVHYPEEISLAQLDREDYEVLGNVTGEGSASYTGLWPIPIFFFSKSDQESGKANNWKIGLGNPVESMARDVAVYKALQSIPEADLLIEPRYHTKSVNYGIWYTKMWVTVTGKAIRIKTDKERFGN